MAHKSLQERVEQAAEAVLNRNGSGGPLDLFQELGWLPRSHFENWRKGHELFPALQPHIYAGPGKQQKATAIFQEWAARRGLRPIEANFTRRGPRGIEPLRVTATGEPEGEKFYCTHYMPGDLPEKKTARLAAKLNRPPELVVFEMVNEDGKCCECGVELLPGDFLLVEKGQPLCLACADLDHLVFLPSGDTALSRRSRRHSSLAAVVLRFSRARKRYERQGLLVTEVALAQAEADCAADMPVRAAARNRAAIARQEEDREFVAALTQAITRRYPGCPADESRQIAEHTGRRSSGRVGRSAAGRALDATAVDLAVRAHVRHAHTNYDELLMGGTERLDARAQVREKIDRVLAEWAGA